MANESRNSRTAWSFDPKDFGLSGAAIATGFGPKDNLSPYGFIRDSRPFGGSEPTNWDQHKDELVSLSNSACGEVKAKSGGRNINIITIGVSDATAPGTRAYTALHNCASSPDLHFYVRDKTDLDWTFDQLLNRLSRLRLSS